MEWRGVRGVDKHYCLVFTFIKPLVMQYIHSCSTLIHAVIKPSLSKIQKKWFLKPNYPTNLLQNKTLVLLNVHMLVITFLKHPWYGEEIVLFILWREFLFCYSVQKHLLFVVQGVNNSSFHITLFDPELNIFRLKFLHSTYTWLSLIGFTKPLSSL